MQPTRQPNRWIPLYTVALAACFVQSAPAARLLQVYIERDGDTIAHTFYDDSGRADAATVWRYLQDPPIMVDDDITRIDTDAGNRLRVTLEGDLRIRIQHVERVIAESRLSNLTLERVDDQTQRWFLPAAEVERTANLAGLGPPSPATKNSQPTRRQIVFGGFVVILVGLLVVTVFLLCRRPMAEDG